MNTITRLSDTNKGQLQLLLEANKVTIKKKQSNHFDIECPTCKESEAYIYFNGKTRKIECNRKNNCGEKIELWDYIANTQGIDSKNNSEMLKYINNTLGLEFKEIQSEDYKLEQEEKSKEQNFLSHCNQIFCNSLNNNKDNEKVVLALTYLEQRGYTKENIKQFGLGFFPDKDDLLKLLESSQYGYSTDEATKLLNKYFTGVLKVNDYSGNEETKNRVTFAWRGLRDNITGFTVRKSTAEDLSPKYLNSNGLERGNLLFNLNNLGKKKELVIVEGLLDALAGSHLVNDEVKEEYHFVATGQNQITEEQAQLLKSKGCSQVILLLDKDKAGEGFLKCANRLRKCGIVPFIARIPDSYEAKDIDELIKKHPEVDVKVILDNAIHAVTAEIERIVIENKGATTDLTRNSAIKACLELKPLILISEDEPYKNLMFKKFKIDTNSTAIEQTTEGEQHEVKKSATGAINIEGELEKLKLEIQLEMKTALAKNNEEEQSTNEEEQSTIDIHQFRKRAQELEKLVLQNNIAEDKNDKSSYLKKLTNILANLQEFNNLLTTNYDLDKPYAHIKLLEKVIKAPTGMSTGFASLDKEVSIQPSSLVFVAGKPSHGKTTLMLNLYRNLIKNNPDKAFLFYSYEEEVQQIWLKIILANVKLDSCDLYKSNERIGYLGEIIKQMKEFKMSSVKTDENGSLKLTSNSLQDSYNEVGQWINEERLQILDRKANIEILSSAIIERVKASKKPVAAIFIDYVQKLNTSETYSNRQQELQKICQTLLNTAMDKRVGAAIVLGAQVNREVISLSTLDMDKIREASDIAQDANLILGVWDEQAGNLDRLRAKLISTENSILNLEFTLEDYSQSENSENLKKLKKLKKKLETHIGNLENSEDATTKTIKILKNRNGKKDKVVELMCYPDRFLLKDVEVDVTEICEKDSVNQKIRELKRGMNGEA